MAGVRLTHLCQNCTGWHSVTAAPSPSGATGHVQDVGSGRLGRWAVSTPVTSVLRAKRFVQGMSRVLSLYRLSFREEVEHWLCRQTCINSGSVYGAPAKTRQKSSDCLQTQTWCHTSLRPSVPPRHESVQIHCDSITHLNRVFFETPNTPHQNWGLGNPMHTGTHWHMHTHMFGIYIMILKLYIFFQKEVISPHIYKLKLQRYSVMGNILYCVGQQDRLYLELCDNDI